VLRLLLLLLLLWLLLPLRLLLSNHARVLGQQIVVGECAAFRAQ
jgi:hypothetical protein